MNEAQQDQFAELVIRWGRKNYDIVDLATYAVQDILFLICLVQHLSEKIKKDRVGKPL